MVGTYGHRVLTDVRYLRTYGTYRRTALTTGRYLRTDDTYDRTVLTDGRYLRTDDTYGRTVLSDGQYLRTDGTYDRTVLTDGRYLRTPQGGRCWGTAGPAVPERSGSSPKGRPPTYAILSRNLVLSRFTHFMNGHHRAFYESHPTLGVFSTKVS